MKRPGVLTFVAGALLLETVLLGTVVLHGCTSAQEVGEAHRVVEKAPDVLAVLREEIAWLKADLTQLAEDEPQAEETARKLINLINEKSEAAAEWVSALQEAQSTIQKDESAWGWAEAVAGLAAGFFPPAAVAIPMIRRSRRAFEGVVASVAAGGGPKDAEAVRKAMRHYPGLKDMVTDVRVKIGDKKMDAVPADMGAG